MSQKTQTSNEAGGASRYPDTAATPSVFSKPAERALIILAIIASVTAVWAMQDFLLPTATAVILALALTPVVKGLERQNLPTAIAATIVVLVTGAIITATAFAIAPGVADLIKSAPEISRKIELKTRPIKEWMSDIQAASEQIDDATKIQDVEGTTASAAPTQSPGGSVMEFAPQAITQVLYVVVLVLFLIVVREPYRKRIIMLPIGRENRLKVSLILTESLSQVSTYLFITTLINVGIAVAVTISFMLLGVPYAAVWGILFGVASYIPYVGPTAVMLLCAVAQLVTAPTIQGALLPPVILVVINFIESNFVSPWLVSRQCAVSSLAIFLTVALFGWFSGPLAAFVAVPLLILFSAVARHVPGLETFAVLLLAENETCLASQKSGLEKLFSEENALAGDRQHRPWWRRWSKIKLVHTTVVVTKMTATAGPA